MATQHPLEILDSKKELRLKTRELPRRTASLLQPGDPRIYYYLAWTSPPII